MLDDTNPDWIPSVLMGYAQEGDFDRYHRCKKRKAHSDDDNSVKSVRVDSSAVNNVPLDSSVSSYTFSFFCMTDSTIFLLEHNVSLNSQSETT